MNLPTFPSSFLCVSTPELAVQVRRPVVQFDEQRGDGAIGFVEAEQPLVAQPGENPAVRRSINVRFAVESTMTTYLCSERTTTAYDCSGYELVGENRMPMLRRTKSRIP
ncbi:hypothetical protein Bpla01_32860 [Burkholderia plantarii]|nr:hypothetical protein Bpla01_32860 [Burkholderia plantarii]